MAYFVEWLTLRLGYIFEGNTIAPCFGSLAFSIHANNLSKVMHYSEIVLFADDISVYCSNTDALLIQAHLNSDLASLSQWTTILMALRLTKYMMLCYL